MRLVLVLLLVLQLLSCKERTKEKPQGEITQEQEINKVFIKETRWGKTLWTLEAERLKERKDTTWIYNFTLKFLKGGKVTSTLTADSGLYLERTGDMTAYGDVYVVTEEGARLWTSLLNWDAKREKIFTDKDVLIKRDGKTIKGKGLTSDPDLENIIIHGRVEGYE